MLSVGGSKAGCMRSRWPLLASCACSRACSSRGSRRRTRPRGLKLASGPWTSASRSPWRSHRLDPDGRLVRSETDTDFNDSPAAQHRPLGDPHNPPTPRPRASGPRLATPRLLDSRLLMGGTFCRGAAAHPVRTAEGGKSAETLAGKVRRSTSACSALPAVQTDSLAALPFGTAARPLKTLAPLPRASRPRRGCARPRARHGARGARAGCAPRRPPAGRRSGPS